MSRIAAALTVALTLLLLSACATASAAAPAPAAAPTSAAAGAPARAAPEAAQAPAAAADSGEPVTCTGTLSGAVKGRFTCQVTVAIDGEKVSFRIVPLDAVAGVRVLVPADFALAAPLRPQSYARDSITAGSAVVELEGGNRYTASGRRGEVTLALDSAERYTQARNFYVVSGTLSAHLAADGAASGEVVLDVRF